VIAWKANTPFENPSSTGIDTGFKQAKMQPRKEYENPP
jgi:hypothetical protein